LLRCQRLCGRTALAATGPAASAGTLLTAGAAISSALGIIARGAARIAGCTDVAGCWTALVATAARTTTGTALPRSASGTSGTASASGIALGRHRRLLIESRDGEQERAFRALAREDDLAVFTAFQHRLKAVQAQVMARSLLAMAPEAGSLEKGSDVFRIGDILFVGRRREFGEVRRRQQG